MNKLLLSLGSETQHNIKQLSQFKEEMSAQLDSLVQSATSKISEICKLEEQAKRRLHDEKIKCQKQIQQIDQGCQQVMILPHYIPFSTRLVMNSFSVI